MANYYTHVSFMMDVGEKIDDAMALFEKMRVEPKDFGLDDTFFEVEIQEGQLWVHGDEVSIDNLAEAVRQVGKTLGLTGDLRFEFASTASRPLLDAFGGGAVIVDFDNDCWDSVSSNHILDVMAHPEFTETLKAFADDLAAKAQAGKKIDPAP